MSGHRLAIHWFRRDLRITDNRAFRTAVDRAKELVPAYFPSTWAKSHPWTGAKRQRQNPWLQSARHDANAEYIRRWLPELRDIPTHRLHEPPKDGQPIADGYPAPIIDHATERNRTLAMFKQQRP